MKTQLKLILIFLLIAFSSFKSKTPRPSSLGKTMENFSLMNVTNQLVSPSDFKDAKGFIIVFTCNHCPFAKLYTDRFNALNLKYSPLGVPFLAINSMDTVLYEEESFQLMQKKAMDEKYNFPYLQDGEQNVGYNFNAASTPHAFVVWKENDRWVVKYSGAIDDNGEHPELAVSFISNAVDELLQGKSVSKAETATFGCRIYYRREK